jgi:hypothetical protein
VTTNGFEGFYVATRNYGATAAFWSSLGFDKVFETGHGSGQWQHPAGGPYVFINEEHDGDPEVRPILSVADASAFTPTRAPDIAQAFTPQHWGVMEAVIRDPDGRHINLQAPIPESVPVPDADAHHQEKYGPR